MNYLSVENLAKNYGDKILFEKIFFGLEKGNKVALVANNGTGKTTLLNILAGNDEPDYGKYAYREGIKLGFLEQEPKFDDNRTIWELIQTTSLGISQTIKEYYQALEQQATDFSKESQSRLELATAEMDKHEAWDFERKMKEILTRFEILNLDQSVNTLSGGQKKRLALSMVLLNNPDLLLLDEPTNHLDIDMIEWLERYLQQSNITFLMVTHDRYFLDRVCNHILEMTNGYIYHHDGNYEYFLHKKAEREEAEEAEIDRARNLFRKELEWMRRMPKARTHKSKARIDAFYETVKKASSKKKDPELKLDIKVARTGGKILEMQNVSKKFESIEILNNFEYIFKKGERVGIIGKNGTGKTTFLNILTGTMKPDSGTINLGETIVFGYYTQQGLQLKEDKRVIEVVKDIAEVITLSNGNTLSASQFLQYFMFTPEMQYNYVSLLSGGEKRRLHLLTVLIKNPNFLILDEPTNDLDILTLNKLEEFLLNYKGCLILVSHDRYFLDRLADHLFVFEGNGKIKDFVGNYTDYRNKQELEEKQEKEMKSKEKQEKEITQPQKTKEKKKLSYKEKLEYENLEKEIEKLESEKSELEDFLNSGTTDFEGLQKASSRIAEVNELIDEKSMRWLELDEFNQ